MGTPAGRAPVAREEMAVRRYLQDLFQNVQLRDSVTVERPLPASRSQPESRLPPTGDAALSWRPRPLPKECAVFQCRGCRAVLGDSLQLCAQEERWLGLLVCFRVTNDVVWEDELLVGLEGALLGCAYNELSCRLCGMSVGFILCSASTDLVYLRGFFCFFKENILCYLLKKQMVIEASKVYFPAVTLKKQVLELKRKIVDLNIRLELLMKKLKELEQNKVAER
ncbi:protein Mis18-beta [Falco peregrinus]|uniref:protein Mis18-beta n=1 Tax=Falco peregrinus TaxID=8954 RepID=UPI002478803B|nr:protein Mis18-beta [Falco peregrinus]